MFHSILGFLPLRFGGYKKLAIFTIPIPIGIDAENQTLINHKCVSAVAEEH
jgi:hypothetical protein